jgi:cell division septation protein DedD
MNRSAWSNQNLDEEGKARWWVSRPFLLVVLALLTVVGLTVFWNYIISGSEGEGDETNIPIVAAESIEIKEVPEVVGGKMAHSDKAVYELISKNTDSGTTVHLKSSEEAPLQTTTFDQEGQLPMVEETVVVEEISPAAPKERGTSELSQGKFKVQVGSLSSQALAEKEWKKIKRKHADSLSGVQGSIVAKSIPGKGTYYRIYLGGFDTKEEAKTLCATLSSQGVRCLVVG